MDHFTIAYVLKTYFNSPCLGMYKYIFAVVVRPCCHMFENNCRSLRNMVNWSSFLNSKASCSPCKQRKHVLPAIRTFIQSCCSKKDHHWVRRVVFVSKRCFSGSFFFFFSIVVFFSTFRYRSGEVGVVARMLNHPVVMYIH